MRKNKGKKIQHKNEASSRDETGHIRPSTAPINELIHAIYSVSSNPDIRNDLTIDETTVADRKLITVIDVKERIIFYSRNDARPNSPLHLLSPPQLGEFALELILSKEESENVIGDLSEDYVKKALRYGVTKAKVWYWKQVISSAWPLLCKVVRWGLLASTAEWIRRRV